MDSKYVSITGVILAGGKSSRIGKDKAFLRIGEETIIERMLSSIRHIFKEVVIVTKVTDRFRYSGVRVIKDLARLQNPLVGIYTALMVSKSSYCFIFACDMPFLNKELIRYMVSVRTGYDIVIIIDKKGFHPLHAIYSTRCLDIIKEHMHIQDFKVTDLLRLVKVKQLNNRVLLRFDPQQKALFNINTQSELRLAREIYKRDMEVQ